MIHATLIPESGCTARLHCANRIFPAVIGAAGVTHHKEEGDHATPVGALPLRKLFYRADRVSRPILGPASSDGARLLLEPVTRQDGWCDDPSHADYNRQITLPHPARHEKLWHEDHVYDIIGVLGYNDDPPVPGRGSAIFLHLQSPDRAPTEGCIALTEADLREALAMGLASITVEAAS
ncbi:L,D-transpeptidase family protein [Acetobacter sp.]|jgi:L,D-peptidoglycan transpeptidase YkuD (ErfK/YbiS/YcfS/YnhG family)|uniref:L,D-transpeptidase family protein n=1 Tax=Acetobacter sp. TaxID=440 RepID=UPI0025B80183|nr:L,D-transpeptidase family protein [Acetobacter sp.]MCH4091484.1 L,D-transpeptidase family protein [Acetobacter sp.]MCI1299462.1 L,D-transpeptidase family protein [Acetobacter sp.]MCI1316948.1 L,D-transpeptidase family protein [Acetobacter sp.]